MLSRVDIVDVVGRHVELKKAGINHKGLCPFHGEKSPSFIVSPSRQTYHCFGCGVHGDAIRFLTELHGVSFVEAVQDLAQQAGMQVPEDERSAAERALENEKRQRQATLSDVLERAAQHYRLQLRQTPRAIDYLKGRGLSGEIAARFGLGYAPDGWHALASAFPKYDDPLLVEAGLVITQGEDGSEQRRYDRFRDRVMFPIRNVKGETIAFGGRVLDKGEPKYLNSPETPIFTKGRELYGLFEARSALRERGYVLVTEGYMDVVALAQLGFPNAVATLGTACTGEHVQKLLRFTDQIVFSFDGDAAGRRAAGRALEASLPHAMDTRSFRFLFLPAEHDPDSFIRALGTDVFETQVKEAVPLSRQLIEHASTDCDLLSVEGRAKMLAQARPLWAALPDGALRVQLLSELARQGGLATDELTRLWGANDPFRSATGFNSGHGAAAEPQTPEHARIDDEWRGSANFSNEKRGTNQRWSPYDGNQRRRGGPWKKWGTRNGSDDGPPPGWTPRRPAPVKPEDRVIQMLFGQPMWWQTLPPSEVDLLHKLPAPHGTLVNWLERNLEEFGARPWAILKEALSHDESVDEDVRHIANGDADPDATVDDFRRALDVLLERELARLKDALISTLASAPEQMERFRDVDRQWREVKMRLSRPASDPKSSS